MQICPKCHYQNRDGARFCSRCRYQLSAAQPLPQVGQSATGRLSPNSLLQNRYLIQQLIGKGGGGAVYRAQDMRLQGKYWAVKELSVAAIPDAIQRQQAVTGFLQEAQFLASLSHPNIPRVTDNFNHQGKYYLVMEFVNGSDLEKLLIANQRPFSEDLVRRWLAQLCDALAYLHSHRPPIIFRDLKPQNIMLDERGEIKLIDFGIARRFTPGKRHDTSQLGTEGYAAPEQYSGQTDERSDIYALGVTLHRLLTGHDPSTTPFNLPPARQVNPTISSAMESIIQRSVYTDPKRRWASIADIQNTVGLTQRTPATSVTLATSGTLPTVQIGSKRPTTHLVQMMSRLTGRQLATVFGGILLLFILGIWFLGPYINYNLPFLWENIPIYLLVGPTAYGALRRIGAAMITHVAVVVASFSTIWARFGDSPGDLSAFLLGTLLSAVVLEAGFYYLGHVLLPQRSKSDSWKLELGWYAGLAVIAVVTFYLPWHIQVLGQYPGIWLGSALVGGLGWFLGDFVHEWLHQQP